MVTLPLAFAATKYPGYFFHTVEKKLYSLKVSGVLTELKFRKPDRFNHLNGHWAYPKDKSQHTRGGYRISVKGQARWLLIEYLESLTVGNEIIPVRETVKEKVQCTL